MNLLNRKQFLTFSLTHLPFKFRITMDCTEKESRVKCFPSRLSFLGLLYTLLPVHTNELASQSHHAWWSAGKKCATWSMKKRYCNKSYPYRPALSHWLHNVNCTNVKQISYSFSNQWQIQKCHCIKREFKLQQGVLSCKSLKQCNELLIWILFNINFDLAETSC